PREDASTDAGACPPECNGGCAGGACLIEGSAPTCRSIRGPAGRPCVVQCTTGKPCAGNIDCRGATDCTIDCSDANSCGYGTMYCGTGRCRITCGTDSCLEVTVFALQSSSFCLDCQSP